MLCKCYSRQYGYFSEMQLSALKIVPLAVHCADIQFFVSSSSNTSISASQKKKNKKGNKLRVNTLSNNKVLNCLSNN